MIAELPADHPSCRWHVLVWRCTDSHYFVLQTLITAAIGFLVFALGTGTLIYRYVYKGQRIWKGGLTTLDSYIALMTAFGLGRGIQCLLLGLDKIPSMTASQLMHDIPQTCGRIAAWIYVLSVVQATPRHYNDSTFRLPTATQLRYLRIGYILAETLVVIPLGTAAGYAYDTGHFDRYVTLTTVLYAMVGFYCVIIGLAYGFFGRQLVQIAVKIASDLNSNVRSTVPSNLESENAAPAEGPVDAKMMKTITKMKMVNSTLMSIGIYYGIILVIFAGLQNKIFALTWWSKIQAVGSNVYPLSLVLTNFCFIIWGEFNPPDPVANPLTIAGKTVSVTPATEGIKQSKEVVVHQNA
ncbi:uncharacterized protein SPPG_01865 [Spizellomyces punctatus DAOM BR117]|uniref:Uncharacterized protein n=1 Tax=Spizellomyces punctatus (strain DAOM BR117) TaxID=645134 RepID=A0A0L0HP01_SPIPD|nr:uncharacterized protein SPPG_01865 [Spizellomyces punctatus DAOM BR117]KND02783.1 hypothetical protein SPPG_01865 [Spizellomyces punctatus DAOM BR117]|eukprot:XP_016610822.1 hypothetical protein SPPG_01865 [Spizellomyces punctatus DAOM BR117]